MAQLNVPNMILETLTNGKSLWENPMNNEPDTTLEKIPVSVTVQLKTTLQYNVKTRLILTLIGLKVRGIRYFLAEDSVLISIQTDTRGRL